MTRKTNALGEAGATSDSEDKTYRGMNCINGPKSGALSEG